MNRSTLLDHKPRVLVEGRHVRNEVHAALTLLLLQLQGNATDGASLDALHQMSGESGDLVTQRLGWDDCDLLGNLLVGLKVHCQTRIVLLDDLAGGPLDSLCANATHGGGKAPC